MHRGPTSVDRGQCQVWAKATYTTTTTTKSVLAQDWRNSRAENCAELLQTRAEKLYFDQHLEQFRPPTNRAERF